MSATKQIAGFAYNLVQQFDASCEHIRYLVSTGDHRQFSANLLTGEISPQALAIPRNANLVAIVQETFRRNIVATLADTVCRAEIVLAYTGGKWVTRVDIETDTGRRWQRAESSATPLVQP